MLRPRDVLPLDDVGVVALDTETNGLYGDDGARVAVVSLAWWRDGEGTGRVEDIVSLAFPFAQGRAGKGDDEDQLALFESEDPNLSEEDWDYLLAWLAARPLVMANAKFDLEKMRLGTIGRYGKPGWVGRDLSEGLVWDTQIAAKELWPQESTSLKPTAERLWGEDQVAEQRALKKYLGPKTNPRFDLVPWDIIGPYAAKDAELTLRLAHEQWCEIEEGAGVLEWVKRELDVMQVLYRMEWRGLPYDAARSLDVAAELAERQAKIGARLPFRPTDPEAKKYFFTSGEVVKGAKRTKGLDLPAYATTDKGSPSLTAEITARMAQEFPEDTTAGRVARDWADYGKVATANKMWYVPYAEGIGDDGRLRTCFRQVASGRGGDGGTRSGRFSVERVNLQAIPQDYRLAGFEILEGVPTPRAIIGEAAAKLEGWELWELDLAQAELRVAASWAGCTPMLSAIEEQRDLHGETTEALFGLQKGDEQWGRYRQIGKRANFTLCFGAGWLTFQKMVAKEAGLKLDDREAARIVSDWNDLYPQYRKAIDRYSRTADRLGFVELANGKRRYFARGEETHKAFNQVVQASLAELGKDWAVASDRQCQAWELDKAGLMDGIGRGGLLLLIHDSQVLLLPEGPAARMSNDIRKLGLDIWDRMFPEVPGEIEAKRW